MVSRKSMAAGVILALAAVSVATALALASVLNRVKAYDEKYRCNVLAGLSSEDLAPKTEKAASASAQKDGPEARPRGKAQALETAPPPVMEVKRVDYDGDRAIDVVLSERPDMDAIRSYVQVSPLRTGDLGIRYVARGRTPILRITGDYAYGTNVTLLIHKGLPLYGKGAGSNAEGALSEDFVKTLRRDAPKPSVAFADRGRYLPPGGRRAVRVEAVSVTNIATEIRRVEPRNVVQLMARDESVYQARSWRWSVDEEDTRELSGACETGIVRCANVMFEKETRLFPVSMRDGGPERGVFLLAVRSADRPLSNGCWNGLDYNPNHYRLVCLTDLGLSVRKEPGGLGVWVTSLLTGRPVESARVEVYSSANILLSEGETDATGWCVQAPSKTAAPFAIVVWTDSDMTFLALSENHLLDETHEDGARDAYLKADELDAFVWSERGIYRHGEKIFLHGLVRTGERKAPPSLPLSLRLRSPKGSVLGTAAVVTDADGSFACADFSVPREQPSGKWALEVALPGKDGRVLASREVKVEAFAPPQVKVEVSARELQDPQSFSFSIAAEHLFGGPAKSLPCEGAVVFEDVPFAPARWKGYQFGNDDLGLKPCFRRLSTGVLDRDGTYLYAAPLWLDSGRPKAAVRATGQGVVFEDGGRPATARKSVLCHYYPYYIGSNLPSSLRLPQTGAPEISLVCVEPNGESVKTAKRLAARIERIDSVYGYRQVRPGVSTWECDRIRARVAENITIETDAAGQAKLSLPLHDAGDYFLTVEDRATGVSFGKGFYLGGCGDDGVRAPLSDPTALTLQPDKAFYRVGERPRLIVKAPFAGHALMSVLRDGLVYGEVLNLTNATSEIVLRPLERDWAPNVDVAISLVQGAAADAHHMALRAHGIATVRLRPDENETDVSLDAEVEILPDGDASSGGRAGARVTVDVVAPNATSAVVTLVDEGIHLMTGEATPDPVGRFARPRTGDTPLYDAFGRILPVVEDGLRANGVKTGGGFGAEMLGRVSPVPTRRFKPLALWKTAVSLKGGKGRVVFDLPEFVGEVRVTAIAYSSEATGAASVRRKVTPKLVMQGDVPRFVAPGDAFDATLTLRNCAGEGGEGEIRYSLSDAVQEARLSLPPGAATNVVVRLRAPRKPGELSLLFRASGLGERHEAVLRVPVRPATAWRTQAEVVRLEPGEVLNRTADGECPRFSVQVGASPMAELASSLEWLADYPHGCLEQTVSRVFPLVTAGGILNSVASKAAADRNEYVESGVRRVESMVRTSDFVMWPDCSYAPWDREVSLYAAHFLVEAEKAGQRLEPRSRARVMSFLRKWALGADACESAYACHTLALAGLPERDRMFRLYDARSSLSALSRARLARAFAALHDRPRAEALMTDALEPQSVKEASFRVLALADIAPDDARILPLVEYLTARRDPVRFSWGTTAENAHALLAMGAYYQHHPVKTGDVRVGALRNRDTLRLEADSLSLTNTGPATAFLSVRRQCLDDPKDVRDEASGLFISRRFLAADGSPADLASLVRGEMLVAELTITSSVARVVGDLVVEDLFAGAFEPVHRELDPGAYRAQSALPQVEDWVMRKDARDDRMLVFSKRFEIDVGHEAKVRYPVRVVSAGDFVLPGPSVEGMYHPSLRARVAPARLVVRH